MNEKTYLLNKKKMMPYYENLFEKNANNLDKLEKDFFEYHDFKKFHKKNPECILAHIATLGLTAFFLHTILKESNQEFTEQLKIWKSIKKN